MALAVSADGRRLYAGTLSGVWRSDDGGVIWHQLTRPQPSQGENVVPGALSVPNVFDVAVSPANADVVLAATAFDTRVQPRNGVYRSEDGGETWSLVHQFTCPGAPGGGPVGQIVFSPDNPNLVYAAGGCAIAISQDAGQRWRDIAIQAGGTAWHVAVAPEESSPTMGTMRRVYAAGDDQIWYSTDGGSTWAPDTASEISQMGVFAVDGTKIGTVGTFPAAGPGNSAQVLAVEPGHPDHLYVTVGNISNGPAYYFNPTDALPGQNCEQTAGRCGGAVIWLGDYSQSSQRQSGIWRRLASPPTYYGGSTLSGRVYIATQRTPRGYLLFLSDGAHVHVSQARPEQSAASHRLDGRDASQSKRENNLANQLFLHVDPHAIAISSDFDITLKQSNIPAPYNQNSELDAYLGGTLWLANDGGVYHSTKFDPASDKTDWQLGSGLATLQPQGPFAGVAVAGNAPALYFGVPDNDDFFSLNGGITWQNNPVIDCGDCGSWFADPAQPNRVFEFDHNPNWVFYTNPQVNGDPDPGRHFQFAPLPSGFVSEPFRGYRPIILTRDDEQPLTDGDYILVRVKPDGTRVLLRTTQASSITASADWDTKATEQGPSLPANVDVVQASGGHGSTVFYVGNPSASGRLWKWAQGMTQWQQIVPASDGSAQVARRFFADPYDAHILYIIDAYAIRCSDDGGLTWRVDRSLDRIATEISSETGTFSYELIGLPNTVGEGAVITDMIFDRRDPGTRFAVGNAGVFFTVDGSNWKRLLSTTAWPGHPVSAYFDSISGSPSRALYVGFNGRGILRLIVPAPGDLNGDGEVDCADLAAVRASFGKKTGDPGFDVSADVDSDGVVDISDLAFVAQKLSKQANCPGAPGPDLVPVPRPGENSNQVGCTAEIGKGLSVAFAVQNHGTAPASDFLVEVQFLPHESFPGTSIFVRSPGDLLPGQTRGFGPIEIPKNSLQPDSTFVVIVHPVAGESNTGNNRIPGRCVGPPPDS